MISICIPTYNYAHYLPASIESCLSQDEDFELLVVDDNSADGTPALKDRYAHDARVHWHENPSTTRLRIQENWNRAVSLARSPYVKLLGADDLLKPGSVRRFREMILDKPDVALHGHLAEVIDTEGRTLRSQRFPAPRERFLETGGTAALKRKLRQQVRFREPVCSFYKKSAWEAVGGYSTSYRFTFDIHLNVKMMSRYPCGLWNDSLVQLRRHASSDGATLSADLALTDLQRLVAEITALIGDDVTFGDRAAGQGWLLYRLLELALQRGRRRPGEAVALLRRNVSLLRNPAAFHYASKLVRSRVLYGDVQQQF